MSPNGTSSPIIVILMNFSWCF